jgi:hypothetical protein
MFVFDIPTGCLTQDGAFIATGYSGSNSGKDNPLFESTPNFGPIPEGLYTIGTARTHPHLGPLAMPLTPNPANVMYSRGGFWLHGDSIKHPGQGSEGCICLPRPARLLISRATDRRLTVISTAPTPPNCQIPSPTSTPTPS